MKVDLLLMDEKQKYLNDDFIGRYMDGRLNAAEKTDLAAWFKNNSGFQSIFEEYTRIWNLSSGISLAPGKTAEERWNAL